MTDWKRILPCVDHTLLAQDATERQIQALCEEAMECHAASVCIPPDRVRFAKQVTENRLAVGTVIGFPNGYMTTASKCFEARDAIQNGANELDTVISVGMLKEGNLSQVQKELCELRSVCEGRILKVIIETCLLTQDEKKQMCELVATAGADYIKTSTGFAKGGATVEDIRLFAACLPKTVKIKAAGGISSPEFALELLDAGASRLGSSRLVRQYLQESRKEEKAL